MKSDKFQSALATANFQVALVLPSAVLPKPPLRMRLLGP